MLLFGGIFFLVGLVITVAFTGLSLGMGGVFFGAFALFPMIFMLVGLGVLLYAFHLIRQKKEISTKGTKYPAKIYGYVEDKSYTLNGDFTINLKVRFFDHSHIEREAVLITNIPKNTNMYSIGMTIDIFAYKGRYDYDKNSLRYEKIPGEEELMDDKPVVPEEQTYVALICPHCGASFSAVKGYANKCPFCSGYMNA